MDPEPDFGDGIVGSLLKSGYLAAKEGKFDEAASFYGATLAFDPKNTRALYNCATIHYRHENQRRPELFALLRVLADRRPLPSRFILLGNVSPDLVKGSSGTLAGRIEFIEIMPRVRAYGDRSSPWNPVVIDRRE